MAALTKGLAAENSFKTQPATLDSAILSDGFCRVSGATGCKAAMLAKKWAQNKLISTNDGKKNLVHAYGFNDLLGLLIKNTCCLCQVEI